MKITNISNNSIYLGDIGLRSSLGGSNSIYVLGQDQYLSPGQSITLIETSDVMLSATLGILKKFEDIGWITIESDEFLFITENGDSLITEDNFFIEGE